MDDLETKKLLIPGSLLSWKAVRASGPGGQNVNKVSSKVELHCDFERLEGLPEFARDRLRAKATLDRDGQLLVVSQKTRDQHKNLRDACDRLIALIEASMVQQKKRKPTKPSRGVNERRVKEKKLRGKTKSTRSRVKAE
jgi:ribosome-associated protein